MNFRQFLCLVCLLGFSLGESSSSESESITPSASSTESGSITEDPFPSTLDSSQLQLSEQIYFFTNLVSDVSSNAADYFFFLRTANMDIPKAFGSIANQVRSYTDDSYTTLLEDPDFEFSSLANFVTNLDWYTERLAVSGINNYQMSSSSSSEDHANAMYVPLTFALFAGVIGLL